MYTAAQLNLALGFMISQNDVKLQKFDNAG